MWRLLTPLYGSQPAAEFFAPDTKQRHLLGTRVTGVDPYWGNGEFVYGKAAATQEMGSVCVPNALWTFADHPGTVSTGFPLYAAIYPMLANQFGWYQCSGMMVWSAAASVAVDAPTGISATPGQLTVGAATRGVNGYVNKLPSSTTVNKFANVREGSAKIEITRGAGYGGWFHGVTLTAVGPDVMVARTITGFDPDQRTVLLSGNIDFTTPATFTGEHELIGTYTGFIAGVGNCPFAIGAP